MKLIGALPVVLTASVLIAQTSAIPSQPEVVFSVANPKVEPVQYSLTIHEDGTGVYKASYTPQGDDSAMAPVDRAIIIHKPILSEVFEAARKNHFFAINCEGRHSKVAFTGQKTLAYSGPDGSGSCAFNYSQKDEINNVAAELTAVETTLAIGAELESELRYDQLSLDSELASLQDAVGNKQALELGNIAPVLQSIASEPAVLNRARGRAERLLQEVPVTR